MVRGARVGVAVLVVLATLGSVADASAAPLAEVVSPRQDALVRDSNVRIVVKTSRRATAFRATLNGTNITRSFRRRGPVRIARVPRSRALTRGVNSLVVTARRRGGRRAVRTGARFVIAGRHTPPKVAIRVARRRGGGSLALRYRVKGNIGQAQVLLNGRRVERHLSSARRGVSRGTLSASQGLRYGRNRLVVLAYRYNGHWDLERRTIMVRRVRPLAGAGSDRRIGAGRRVRLDGRASRAPRRGRASASARRGLRYRWRVVGRPSGSKPRLVGAQTGRPLLRTGKPGRYRVRLTVRSAGGRTGSDLVTIIQPPPTPPLGTPIHTIAPSGGAFGLSLLGQVTTAPAGGNLSVFVIDRQSLQVTPQSYAVNEESGISALEGQLEDLSADKLVVLSSFWTQGAGPVPANLVNDFNEAVAKIGGDPLAAAVLTAQAPAGGTGFSVIGVPNSADTHAIENPGLTLSAGALPGDLAGYLSPNGPVSSASTLYSFSSPDYFTFDTNVAGAPPGTNVMNLGPLGNTPPVGLEPPSATGGFEVVVLDSATLEPVPDTPAAFATNGSGNCPAGSCDLQNQQAMADYINQMAASFPGALFFIQSIGAPAATTTAWATIAQALESIGSNADVFNRLDGSFEYAYVGGAGIQGTPAETASKLATYANGQLQLTATGTPGELNGLLARNGQSRFQAVLNDPFGSFNYQLPQIAYQAPTPWQVADPTSGTTGQRNAMAFIAAQLFPCTGCAPPTDVRPQYFSNSNAVGDWGGDLLTDLRGLCYPWASGCALTPPSEQPTFTQADFQAVQGSSTDIDNGIDSLDSEFQYVEAVQNLLGGPNTGSSAASYSGALQKVFDPTAPLIDLTTLRDDVQSSVDASGGDQASGPLFDVVGEAITALSYFGEGPVAQAALGVMASSYFLAGSQSDSPLEELEAAVDELDAELLDSYSAQALGIEHIGEIIVSDWGKLKTVGAGLISTQPQWSFDASNAGDALGASTVQWFYGAVMPVEWAGYQLNPGKDNSDPKSANGYNCADKYPFTLPFDKEPPTGQFASVAGYSGTTTPSPITRILAWGKGNINGGGFNPSFDNPSSSLTDPLFANPADTNSSWSSPGNAGVGLFPAWFWARNFKLNQIDC